MTESGTFDTFADRLNRVFDAVPCPDEEGGGRYSVAEVAEGVGVTRQHLNALLNGTKQRPGWELVQALARFFGVSVIVFDDGPEAENYRAQLDLLGAMQQSGVHEIATRAKNLTAEHRRALAAVAREFEALETGSDDVSGSSTQE